MKRESKILHLAAWAREEIEALERTGAALAAEEAALVAGDLAALESALHAIAAAADAAPARAARRDVHVRALAADLGVPAGVLTLASIAERVGAPAGGLLELRDELRAAAAEVARRTRRVRRIAGVQREVNRELLELVLAGARADGRSALTEEGTLLDARA